VRRTRRLAVAQVPPEVARRHLEVEELSFLPVLVADRTGQLAPTGPLGIDGRIERVETDVAEAARHADEIRRLHALRALAIRLGVPVGGVELRIGELAQPRHACWLTGNARYWRLRAAVHPQAVLI